MKDYKNNPAATSFNDQLTAFDLILTVLFAVTFYSLIFLATI